MRMTQDLMEWAVGVIDKELKLVGSVDGAVAIMRPGGIHMSVLIEGPGASLARSTAVKEVKKAQAAGWLDGVVHISEAWAVAYDGPGETVRPSQHPDCREIVFVYAYGEDGKSVVIWNLDRDRRGVRRGQPMDMKDADATHWLDEAFDSTPTGNV